MEQYNDEIQLKDILIKLSEYRQLLWQKKVKIIFFSFLFFVFGVLIAFLLTTRYKAELTFVVEDEQNISSFCFLLISYNIVSFWSLLLRVIISGATVMGCGIVLVWWQGEFILRLLYNASYSEYHSNFVLVMCAGLLIITSTTLGEGLFACQRYKTRLAAVAIGFSCNGLICYFTIAQGGLKSAVVALICSGGITVVFSWVCLLVITLNQYAKQRE